MARILRISQRYQLILASLFSFILGCMLSVNLMPLDKTCRIENEDREYNIMNNSKLKSPDLIIFILSAPSNKEKRDVIRNTWLKLIDGSRSDNFPTFIVRHYFVVGSFELELNIQNSLKLEQSTYDDVLILPMKDSYNNLTEKVLKSFVWLKGQMDVGLDFKYVLKCDDDSFVKINDLVHELKHLEIIYLKSDVHNLKKINDNSSPYIRVNVQSNNLQSTNRELYWGYFKGNAQIKSSGKWKETEWILCDAYLPYAVGGGYILSKSLVTYLARNANNLRYYNSEDVSVGVWLSGLDNIVRIHDIRFDTEWKSRGCQNYHLVKHGVSEADMAIMYQNIVETNLICKKQVIERPHYLYNWLLPPSKCCSHKM